MRPLDRIEIFRGDITSERVDAIVNAANTDLLLGSGVAGAIRVKGGPSIQDECDAHGPVELGGAALTGGGNLPAANVIHAAAMHLGGLPTEESIRQAVQNSLAIADRERFDAISFPAIGTGVGGFPMEEAARIILEVTVDFLRDHDHPKRVRFVLLDEVAVALFRSRVEGLKQRVR